MPKDRFFIDEPLVEQTDLIVTKEERHHLVDVMRIEIGEKIEIVNGRNQKALASLKAIHKKEAILTVEAVTQNLPSFQVILCQAICRMNRLEFLVEKGTELGMTELWLFPGDKSEKETLSDAQLDRLKRLSIAALKQCGRLDLPSITVKPPLSAWNPTTLPYPSFYGDLDSEAAPFFKEALSLSTNGVCFFIGPEAGFSPHEKEHLKKLKAKAVLLHPYILRTETAPLVALSLIAQKSLCEETKR